MNLPVYINLPCQEWVHICELKSYHVMHKSGFKSVIKTRHIVFETHVCVCIKVGLKV